ncbi:YcxB family protein [Streptomyces sp. NPDC052676]|uniref:YcxB family protein n=1 Tax=Streptomyces sp. NPDC052676 TaxID=3154953 RepID=UPI003445FD02
MSQDVHGAGTAVELAYRPTRSDIAVGIRTRDRVRRIALVRGVITALFAAVVVFGAVGGAGALSLVLYSVCAAVIWGTPYLQANHVFRTVSWQGEYRATVGAEGITTRSDHASEQRWSMFRGFRERRDHFVLLSRDPGILVVEMLPKRGLGSEADVDRLRALLARHLPAV